MLESMMVILPAVMAAATYRIFHSEVNFKKNWKGMGGLAVFYILGANLFVLGGLELIGLGQFDLFEMNVRFKLKWLVMEFAFGIVLTLIYGNIRTTLTQRLSLRRQFKKLFPALLFLNVTYAIYTPSSLFLSNINEFAVSYFSILPIIIAAALLLTAAVFLVAVLFTNENTAICSSAFIFALALGIYIQGNFLNPELPSLNGVKVDWSIYARETRVSSIIWGICILGIPLLSYLQKDKAEKLIRYGSFLFSAMQMVSLMVLVLTNPLSDSVNCGFTKEGQFSAGSEENVIVFILDTLQTDSLKEYIMSDAYPDGALDDFVFYEDAVAGAAPTSISMPLLFTGMEYDPGQPLEEYRKTAWQETSFYDDIHAKGYDVRFYTHTNDVGEGCTEKIADNYAVTGSHWIGSYPAFGGQLYKLVNYYLSPQIFKSYFWLSTDALMDLVEEESIKYRIDDVSFYKELKAAGEINTSCEKAFRVYHLNGVHAPCHTDSNVELVGGGNEEAPEQETLQGVMKIVYTYIDGLKTAGVYDNSMIIICGDHGRIEVDSLSANPPILVKRVEEKHPLSYNSAPVHFRNVMASMASCVMEDYSPYGPALWDITEDSDVERMHTVHKVVSNQVKIREPHGDEDYLRFIISGKADGGGYRLWNPYDINRISYRMGDKIDFTSDDGYAKEINYRLYKENNAAVASNELSICFDFGEIPLKKFSGDMELHFVYADVRNDSQLMKVYANAEKAGEIVCTRENIGKEQVINISPKELRDEKLALRMVFPGAVTATQLDGSDNDTRVLSVAFTSMWLTQ